jgi:hypothetical protein
MFKVMRRTSCPYRLYSQRRRGILLQLPVSEQTLPLWLLMRLLTPSQSPLQRRCVQKTFLEQSLQTDVLATPYGSSTFNDFEGDSSRVESQVYIR